MMNKQIFRKKSIERISSPEQLNEYIRVSNPGVWMVLAAIIILLAGACVWGVAEKLETTVSTVAISDGTNAQIYVREAEIGAVKEGMTVRIEKKEYKIKNISPKPSPAESVLDDYAMHIGNVQKDEWVYVAAVEGVTGSGVYSADIVTEQISPISFITN